MFHRARSYHQKVPPVAPALDFQATHGLVEPVAFTIAPKSSAWTASAYAGFSITKNVQKVSLFLKILLRFVHNT